MYIKAMCMLQANFLWAYATLGERMSSACLEALATQAQAQLPQFKAQELANMMLAFAKLSYSPNATLLQSCEAHDTRIAGEFTPRGLVRRCLYVSKRHHWVFDMPLMLYSTPHHEVH